MMFLEYVFVFIFGTIIGSFLNVLVLRTHTGKTLSGRSACFSCGSTLSTIELFPILSFLFQKGRCRSCESRISFQYPFVEFLLGITFLGLWFMFSPSPLTHLFNSILYALVFFYLIAIAVYDFRHGIIPNRFVYPLLGIASLVTFLFPQNAYFIEGIAAGSFFFLCFFALWFFSKGKLLGLGDAKLVSVFGLILGFPLGLSAIVLSFWIAALYALFLFSKKYMPAFISTLNSKHPRITMKTEVPFAPFLISGFYIVFFTGFNLFLL